MAQQQKKPAAKKPAAKKKTAAKKAAPAKEVLIRREVWAGTTLFFAFVAFLSFFNVKGFVIDWYRIAVGSLIGYGIYLMPFALTAAGVLLILKRRGKARLRVACILLLPLLMGAVSQLLITQPMAEGGFWAACGALLREGRAAQGGGLIAGGLAVVFRAALSQIGAIVFCVLAMITCVVVGFNTSLRTMASRMKPLPEPEEDETVPVRPFDLPLRRKAVPSRCRVDIPLDDPQTGKAKKPAEPAPAPEEELPVIPPNVPTPADVLRGKKRAAQVAVQEEALQTPLSPVTPDFTVHDAVPTEAQEEPHDASPQPEPVEEAADAARQIEQALREAEEADRYFYPPISLLHAGAAASEDATEEIQRYAERLRDTLQSFGIESNVVSVTRGPTVTRYELQLSRGVKLARVASLSDDIALSLGAANVRISTIPDKQAVGIEVPNDKQEMVTIRDIIDSKKFRDHKSKICFAVGKDIAGDVVVGDIATMPHMLIAGTTGSGKSVCINSILISLVYKATPEEVRLIMVDPKMIELGVYNGIPHLLIPVVTDPKKAAGALNWAVSEMMKRYKLFSEVQARNLADYNKIVEERGEGEKLPQIVIVIDELADLMLVAANEVEDAIVRIAQMARAAGMHLIIATQRPSADVITGLMKANIPSRVAFTVASQIESRIILDQTGAEKLIGKGDMLFNPLSLSKPMRVQGCFITTAEVEEVTGFIKKTGKPDYSSEVMEHIERQADAAEGGSGGGLGGAADDEDSLLPQAIEIVVESGQASVSMLQRRLKLGYSRAARLVDQMEERGIVGPFEGSKPRPCLITRDQWAEMVLRQKTIMD